MEEDGGRVLKKLSDLSLEASPVVLILIVELIKSNGINSIANENTAVGLVFRYTPLTLRNLHGGFPYSASN